MRRWSSLFIAGVAALAACSGEQANPVGPAVPNGPALSLASSADGQYIVMLRGNASNFEKRVAELGGSVVHSHKGAGIAVVAGLSANSANQLANANGVADVFPDAVMSLPRTAPEAVVPMDEVTIQSQANPATSIRYSWQWNMRAIGAQHAWAAGKLGSSGVTVAILDTGIDYNSLDHNGLVDLSRSKSFVASDNTLRATYFPARHEADDFNGHGTNVASQVATMGVAHAGVTSRTTLIAVKVIGQSGSGSISNILMGILYAADQGADVINMSLGFAGTKGGKGGAGSWISLINQVTGYARKQGAVIVAAAGNSAMDLDRNLVPDSTGTMVHYPSLYSGYCDTPNVICVSSTGPLTFAGTPGVFAGYSNYGRSAISVSAPGGNIASANSAWPWGNGAVSWVWSMCPKNYLPNVATPAVRPCASGGVVTAYIGTSQAAPHVAGLAALLVAEMGKNIPAEIRARILETTDDLGPVGTDPYHGKGGINVARALGL